jgi:hypothetical protein
MASKSTTADLVSRDAQSSERSVCENHSGIFSSTEAMR